MALFFDTHAHLQEKEFESDLGAVIGRARDAGVATMVVPAVDLVSAEGAVALSESHGGIYATAGYHPHEADRLTPADLDRLEALLLHSKVVAVGEIGLDFYRDLSPRDTQHAVLESMLDLAERHGLPVVIHCRDAWEAIAPTLQPWARRVREAFEGRPLGVLHYFSSSIENALTYYELGFLVSIHTSVTHPKAEALRQVAAALPLEALVIETDSPYGAPQSQRGKRNEPAFVVEAASRIAAERGIEVDTVAAATAANAQRLFGIEAREPALHTKGTTL